MGAKVEMYHPEDVRAWLSGIGTTIYPCTRTSLEALIFSMRKPGFLYAATASAMSDISPRRSLWPNLQDRIKQISS